MCLPVMPAVLSAAGAPTLSRPSGKTTWVTFGCDLRYDVTRSGMSLPTAVIGTSTASSAQRSHHSLYLPAKESLTGWSIVEAGRPKYTVSAFAPLSDTTHEAIISP